MKVIKLSQGKVAMVDNEDYDWLMTWNWYAEKHGNTFYARTNLPRKDGHCRISMHGLLMMHPRGMDIDHIDHNGFNNQKNNLRVVSHAENLRNRRSDGTSQHNGVSWNKKAGKWQASGYSDGKSTYLGLFHDEHKAHVVAEAARMPKLRPGI